MSLEEQQRTIELLKRQIGDLPSRSESRKVTPSAAADSVSREVSLSMPPPSRKDGQLSRDDIPSPRRRMIQRPALDRPAATQRGNPTRQIGPKQTNLRNLGGPHPSRMQWQSPNGPNCQKEERPPCPLMKRLLHLRPVHLNHWTLVMIRRQNPMTSLVMRLGRTCLDHREKQYYLLEGCQAQLPTSASSASYTNELGRL